MGGGYVPSLLFGLNPNYGRSNEGNGDLLQMDLCMHCCIQCPWSCNKPLSTHASTGDSWTLTGKSGSVSRSFLLAPGAHKDCLCPPSICFPVLLKFGHTQSIHSHMLKVYSNFLSPRRDINANVPGLGFSPQYLENHLLWFLNSLPISRNKNQ